jgi:predicted 3-demethylubiquinone-9 3-methyltransferase (glyoxalase superfamily)
MNAVPTSEQIVIAANWLADNWHVAPQPLTRTLREMFGLGFNDAVKAMAQAKRIVERR